MLAAPGGAPRSLIVLAHAGLALLLVDILFAVTQQDPSTSNGRRLRENKLKGKAFWAAKREALAHREEIAREVTQSLRKRFRTSGGGAARDRILETYVHTVVGASANASSLLPRVGEQVPASSVALLSARPDGPKEDMLSLLFVVEWSYSKPIVRAMEAFFDGRKDRANLLQASVKVDGGANGGSLECGWLMHQGVWMAVLVRLMCHREGWHAREAMQSRRLSMTLNLSTPSFTATIPFTTEAIDRLPTSARVSVCLDMQYFDFIPKRDFDEWATAQHLLGVDRIYVPDQLAYRMQHATQFVRGVAVPTHDLPHRYVSPGGRSAPQNATYQMKLQSDAGLNYLCLHEHWYDDWIGMSWTPDEYLSFNRTGAPPPSIRTNMISESLSAFAQAHARDTFNRGPPFWPFCVNLFCVNRPFYGPPELRPGEAKQWTLPNEGLQQQFSVGSQLAMERFTRRYGNLPNEGSNRKCFVHPDYRLGSRPKLHGFYLRSCPERLLDRGGCAAAKIPVLWKPCRDLCGFWGKEWFENSATPPAPGCGGTSADKKDAYYHPLGGTPRDHTETRGPVIEGFELAHFRIPPPEVVREGFEEASWLRNLSAAVRPIVEASNRVPVSSSDDEPLARAFSAELERLSGIAARAAPSSTIASARREARWQAIERGHLVRRHPAHLGALTPTTSFAHVTPASAEGARAAIELIEKHLAQALWLQRRTK